MNIFRAFSAVMLLACLSVFMARPANATSHPFDTGFVACDTSKRVLWDPCYGPATKVETVSYRVIGTIINFTDQTIVVGGGATVFYSECAGGGQLFDNLSAGTDTAMYVVVGPGETVDFSNLTTYAPVSNPVPGWVAMGRGFLFRPHLQAFTYHATYADGTPLPEYPHFWELDATLEARSVGWLVDGS